MSHLGHLRRFCHVRDRSGLLSNAEGLMGTLLRPCLSRGSRAIMCSAHGLATNGERRRGRPVRHQIIRVDQVWRANVRLVLKRSGRRT